MAEIRRPLIVDAGRRRRLAATEVLPCASIDQIAGIAPTLDLDFATQTYRHYSPSTGLRSKPLSDIVTFTRASSAQYWDAKGVMRLAGSNEPRIDFDPVTGLCRGLLIEEARTNLLTYSEEFDNADWVKTDAGVTANVVIAPDGTLTADKLVEGTSIGTHILQRMSLPLSEASYTLSVYLKAGERTWARVTLIGGTTTHGAYFNLSTGVVGITSGGVIAAATPIGNGWFRCSITANVVATESAIARVITASGDNGQSYTGDGTSGIYIWGAQLEAGSFPTSYIPTTNATATRAADVAVVSGAAFSDFYRQGVGTVLSKGVSGSAGGVHYQIGSVSWERIFVEQQTSNTGRALINANGTGQALFGSVNLTSTVAVAFSENNSTVSTAANSLYPTDTSCIIPVASSLSLGNVNGAFQLNGHIARLAYWPSRLPNATLQQLTAG